MKKIRFLKTFLLPCLFLLPALLVSCSDYVPDSRPPHLVIEGWIDDGGFPTVLLTVSMPVSTEGTTLENAGDLVVSTARVAVSDGEQEVVLTGKVDRSYFPPFVYTTGRLRGQAGRTYRLTVDYEGGRAQAVTTIPAAMPPVRLSSEPCAGSDSLCLLTAAFSNPPGRQVYYKVFAGDASQGRTCYRSSFMGAYDGSLLPAEARIPVYRGHEAARKDFTPYFVRGERVNVKIAVMDRGSFDFWKSYEDMVSLSRNPLFPVTANLSGNVEGAWGCWCGYGAREFSVAIGEDGTIRTD